MQLVHHCRDDHRGRYRCPISVVLDSVGLGVKDLRIRYDFVMVLYYVGVYLPCIRTSDLKLVGYELIFFLREGEEARAFTCAILNNGGGESCQKDL